ncbi:serine O-acetyltransferase [Salaquimonas pukyongi]|uniref:serine O-acetyltransferase n=1 Tax=Salaquimonas pukyongi TaxID=2712698 RepID=UPI00096BC503|nr:serine O-acetyltransferase [Salaquimonas pukyongi]
MSGKQGAQTNPANAEIHSMDPVWQAVCREAKAIVESEPMLGTFIYSTILNQPGLEAAVAHRIAERLHNREVSGDIIHRSFEDMHRSDPDWGDILRSDIAAVYDRDPACDRLIEPILYFKGFHAIQTHRLANWAWYNGRKDFALYLQSRSSQVFQTDINPQAKIGRGFFLDHATGLVIGATCVIGNDVSILQGVTLGGTGKETGDRHPKIDDGVLIGAGATVLGNIRIGKCSRIAAGSMVIKEVESNVTVAGVPGRVVGVAGCAEPSRSMDQILAEQSEAG